MLINKNTRIFGAKIVLVPYEMCHVPKYHQWMQSDELLSLTASEQLSLAEEYKNQESWREDPNKCTFIIIDLNKYKSTGQDEIASMVGDVNIFFNDPENKHSAEIEVMVAEPVARRRGLGKESVCCMMKYGIEDLNVNNFTAKIGEENKASRLLFEKIGFKETSQSGVFKEITYQLPVTSEIIQRMKQIHYEVKTK